MDSFSTKPQLESVNMESGQGSSLVHMITANGIVYMSGLPRYWKSTYSSKMNINF